MLKGLSLVWLLLLGCNAFSQPEISGHVQLAENWHNQIYLSVIYDYRRLDYMGQSQVIAQTTVDSNGYFEFNSPVFTAEELIYRLHLTEDSNEVEVYLSDFSTNGFGFNHLVFTGKKGDKVAVEPAADNRLFGRVVSENKSVETWQVLSLKALDHVSRTIHLNDPEKGHLEKQFQTELVDWVDGKGPVAGVIAAFFSLKEDVDLSPEYLEAFESNRDFFYGLLQALEAEHPFYASRLKKELAVVDLQLGESELIDLKSENRWLYGIIILLLGIVAVLGFKIMKRKGPVQKINLTAQEQKIQGLILDGKSNKEIAEALFISLSTVKTHINTLYKKQGVTSRKALIDKESTGV